MTTTLSTHPIDAQTPITTVDELANHLHQAAALELLDDPAVPLRRVLDPDAGHLPVGRRDVGVSHDPLRRHRGDAAPLPRAQPPHRDRPRRGLPALRRPIVPTYPSPMLHRVPTLMLQLEPCTTDLMRDVFMPLELPAKSGAPAQSEQYNTIGQFYAAITLGFETLSSPRAVARRAPRAAVQPRLLEPGRRRQAARRHRPAERARRDHDDRRAGRGHRPANAEVPMNPADPAFGFEELSHYAKFSRIAEGVDVIGSVWPVPTNPTRDAVRRPGRRARRALRRRLLLRAVHDRRDLRALERRRRSPATAASATASSGRSSPRWAGCCTRSPTCSCASPAARTAATPRRRSAGTDTTTRRRARTSSRRSATPRSPTSLRSAATTACASSSAACSGRLAAALVEPLALGRQRRPRRPVHEPAREARAG